MSGEVESAGFLIRSKDGDIVTALVTAIEKLAGWIEIETARVVSACPNFLDIGQVAVWADGKNADAVMQAISRIDKAPVGGDENLGAEIAARKAGRQSRNRLPRGQSARWSVVIEQHNGRGFFLNRIQPACVRMKMKMSWTIARRQKNGGWVICDQLAVLFVKFPNEDLIES